MPESQPASAGAAAPDDATVEDDAGPAARRTPWRFRRRRLADLGTWPFRVGICAVLAVTIGLAALQGRGALDPPQWAVIALVCVAVLPWLVDLLVAVPPPWVFAPAVIVPVAVLHEPAELDPLPFLLAVLALDMGLQLGPTRSAPIVLGGAGIVGWQIAAAASDPGRPGSALVVSIVAGWLIGLALHSQVQRVARLREAQRTVALRAAAEERARLHRDVDALVGHRVRALVDELETLRGEVERGQSGRMLDRLTGAERHARSVLVDLEERLGAGEPLASPDGSPDEFRDRHGSPP